MKAIPSVIAAITFWGSILYAQQAKPELIKATPTFNPVFGTPINGYQKGLNELGMQIKEEDDAVTVSILKNSSNIKDVKFTKGAKIQSVCTTADGFWFQILAKRRVLAIVHWKSSTSEFEYYSTQLKDAAIINITEVKNDIITATCGVPRSAKTDNALWVTGEVKISDLAPLEQEKMDMIKSK